LDSAVLHAVVSLIEAITATEIQDSIATIIAAIAEGVSSSESEEGERTASSNAEELASASDSIDSSGAVFVDILEALSLLDEQDLIRIANASIEDILTALDVSSWGGGSVVDAILLEEGIAQDIASVLIAAIRFYNGIQLLQHLPVNDSDIRLKVGETIIGAHVIAAADTPEGAVRIKVNGNVKALQRAR
jgi:hypothetical protein